MSEIYEPCRNCVFRSDGYGDDDLCINLYCIHPSFARCRQQCPTVQSYEIKRNLGLIE